MSSIYVKMFGTPIVTKDGKEILFPYNKVKALFYYLIVNKQASRDELAGLLWSEENENIAKKNLRNAIYKIKKSFGEEILISPKKSIVMLNGDIDIKSDIDIFLNDNEKWIEAYTGEFLQGFFVKNAEEFEDWIIKARENYQEQYQGKLYDQINKDINNCNASNIERYAKLLISVDEFDEKAYRILMEYYKENKNYGKVIETYNKLSQLLDKELGIAPDEHTRKIFNEVLDIMNESNGNKKESTNEFFYGRCNELRLLENNYEKFIKGNDGKSIIITGEAGIGKSRLIDKFVKDIDEDETYIFETSCYQVEKEYFLKPWNTIISKISDTILNDKINIPTIWENIISTIFPEFHKKDSNPNIKLIENIDTLKYEMIGDVLTDILKKINEKKKVIFIFDDIQWMDSMSLSLLSSVMLHQNKNNNIFIATCRNEYDSNIDKFMTTMNSYNKVITVNLPRFTSTEVEGFIRKALPNYNMTKEMLKKIYDETEGNTFFLTEYLNIIKSNGDTNIMSVKMQDILKSRFLYISDEGKKILNIASLFFDEVPLDILEDLTGKDELELIDIIEELENKFILKEVNSNDKISFKFTHQKLREFVYIKQSDGRKKILHNKIGNLLEKGLKNDKTDINTYHKLIYHYSNGDNRVKSLNYKIKSLNYYLNFSHELFPILSNPDSEAYKYAYFSKQQTIKHLKDIDNLLKEVKKKEGATEQVVKLEIAFLHMKGRYLIREGDYEQGTAFIQEMIEKSIEIKDRDYGLEGYKQMIYYCIQTNKTDLMIRYVELALDLAVECNYHKEIGILLRLKGLYKIMCGEYEEAEKLLNESINIFNVTKQVADKYSLNIAAAYNYIGEIRRFNMKFSEALNYYDKAIAICENKNALTSLAVFNINAGQAAFDMGDYYGAKDYFEKAYSLYNQFDSIWRRSILEAFMALLYVKEGNYSEGLQYLKNADAHSQKLKNPHEIGVVYRIKAEIRVSMEGNENLNKIYSKYLDKDIDYYCDEGIKFLKEARDNYEIEVINVLRKANKN
ncbi:Tetratricopeptide repeat protein [Clostridium liquoris]|jgi:DNA-binding SARP family transcriptional activator/nucleoside-triphosphatase THEP1|uniref:Tetratricopeptide repeat protein n=1 Tax=Clostridium liquoris TaxID=1289519 RepID=A0A2T0B0A1_9CLOT|nr:AAA family ATPase [Clostridium liquoris]PRR76875.1 Tetratricopeptide repeat protein [Clostridium liquoris]